MKNVGGLILFVGMGQIWLAAAASAGPVQEIGACCTCPPDPWEPGVCTPDLTEPECDALGGWWIMGYGCDPNPCPGVPYNDECMNSNIVDMFDFSYICSISGNDCPMGMCPEGEGDCVDGQMIDYINRCATDDDPDLPTDCASDGGDLTYDTWFSFTGQGHGELGVWTCDIVDFDTMIAVYEATPADCLSGPDNEIACDDDGCDSGDSSEVWVTVWPGRELLIRIGGWETDPPSGGGKGEGNVLFIYSSG